MIFNQARDKGIKIHLPVDFVCSDKKDGQNLNIRDIKTGIQKDWFGLDIGNETIKQNSEIIARAKTILWNGPQGFTRVDTFKKGTLRLLDDLITATAKGAITVVGGGDSVVFVGSVKGAGKKLSHISSGRGASFQLLEGKVLPGLNNLTSEEELEVYLKSANQ